MTRALIPELVLRDHEAGAALRERVCGFSREGGRMVLGSQEVILSQGAPDGRHGRIDHLALSVPEVPSALEACLSRGGRLSGATPEGPLAIPEFWGSGIDYVFLDGPGGSQVPEPAERRLLGGLRQHAHPPPASMGSSESTSPR